MVDAHSVDEAEDSVLSEQNWVDVLLDRLKNILSSRLIIYFSIIEIIFIALGVGLDYMAGPYSESTDSIHVMASIFGVFAIYIAIFFVLISCLGVFFAVTRTIFNDI